MFMQHVHGAEIFGVDMQHDIQHEDLDMKHGNAAGTCSMETWTWSLDVKHGHTALACRMDTPKWT
jgi:hypothetical protein